MNASNAGEVGQIRRSRGISRKMRMNEQILWKVSIPVVAALAPVNLQADYAEKDDPVEVEDVGDS